MILYFYYLVALKLVVIIAKKRRKRNIYKCAINIDFESRYKQGNKTRLRLEFTSTKYYVINIYLISLFK